MAWKWIRISLESRMGCHDGSDTKTKSYKPVSQIACVIVSNDLVLIVHIPTYLGSREEPFCWNSKFFCCVYQSQISTNSYILICIIQIHTHKFICNLYVNLFFIRFCMNKFVLTNQYTLICICKICFSVQFHMYQFVLYEFVYTKSY